MKELEIDWREFIKHAENLTRVTPAKQQIINLSERNEIRVSKCPIPLFRGVTNKSYELKTTLDRVREECPCGEYYRDAFSLLSQLDPDQKSDYSNAENLYENFIKYYSYLRHHSFPSPWLDWTFDPYIALFFAFSDIYYAEDKAIYLFRTDLKMKPEYDYLFSVYCISIYQAPEDPYNPRSKNQKSFFTECKDNNSSHFGNHHKILSKSDDLLIKYNVSNQNKREVIEALKLRNISFCSLYGDTQENKVKDCAMTLF